MDLISQDLSDYSIYFQLRQYQIRLKRTTRKYFQVFVMSTVVRPILSAVPTYDYHIDANEEYGRMNVDIIWNYGSVFFDIVITTFASQLLVCESIYNPIRQHTNPRECLDLAISISGRHGGIHAMILDNNVLTPTSELEFYIHTTQRRDKNDQLFVIFI